MRVLLVSNYVNDRQESMLRFASALERGLTDAGVEVARICPRPIFGRVKPGGTGLGKWLGYFDKFVLFPAMLRARAKTADVVHICDHSNAMYLAQVARRRHLITCNDMLAIRSARGEFAENQTGFTGRLLQRWIASNLRRAQRLTCISEATRRDVLRLTGQAESRVSVTYMGLNYPYAPVPEIVDAAERRRRGEPVDVSVWARYGLPAGPYLIHVGGTQWYKNRKGVLEMYAGCRERLDAGAPGLVLVGRPTIESRVEVEYRAGVSEPDLAALYSGAEALLFPSLEEGFGWPIIEAQACGCRVVTTGKAPMTEVGGNAAMYLDDAGDAKAGSEAIVSLLRQPPETRREMVAAGLANAAQYSSERMIAEYVAIYEELMAR